jgi:GNAT superfamily N-acetyltransferase
MDVPPEHIKHLPRYPTLPAVRIGRLAVDERFHGRGLGAAILADAGHRTMRSDAAAFAILVDAKNDHAVAFYQRQGFRALVSRPRALFLPIATMQQAFHRKPGPNA